MKRLIAILAIGLLGTAALASPCNDRIALAAPGQILLPSYYPVQGQPSQANDAVLQAILDELRAIREQLGGRASDPYTMEGVALQACAACHTAGKQPKAGFIMVDKDGKLNSDLSLGDRRAIYARVMTTDKALRMPPERTLNAGALKAVESFTKGK